MFNFHFFHALRHAMLALLLAGGASLAGAATYHVDLDTSNYTGTGYLDLFFNGADRAPAALATLGGKFSFDISFSGAYNSVASDAGSTFSLSIYDHTQMAYLGYQGAAVVFNLLPLNAAGPAGITAEANGLATVTAVPEPAEWLMLLAGLTLVGMLARRRAGR